MPDEDTKSQWSPIGELSRNLAAMEARIDKRFEALDKRFDSLQFVHRESYNVQVGALIDRVEALEEDKKWTRRAFMGAFLYPTLVGIAIMMLSAR